MSSCGGLYQEGMKIFGAILECPNPVTVFATKWARSMTSLIPLAADKFVMRPTAQYMYHDGTFSCSGIVQQVRTDFVELIKDEETMYRIYVARLKSQGDMKELPEKEIREILEDRKRRAIDVWFSAQEAKRLGFVDEVFDGNLKNLRATTKNEERRRLMFAVLNKPVRVRIIVS
jgi:ATP-dependent protease ClpP protease subunit